METSSGSQALDHDAAASLNKLYFDTHLKMKADQASLQASIKKDIEAFVKTMHPEASTE